MSDEVFELRNRLIDFLASQEGIRVTDSGYNFAADIGDLVCRVGDRRYEITITALS